MPSYMLRKVRTPVLIVVATFAAMKGRFVNAEKYEHKLRELHYYLELPQNHLKPSKIKTLVGRDKFKLKSEVLFESFEFGSTHESTTRVKRNQEGQRLIF